MQARKMILAVLVGGPLAGTLLGLAADPQMTSAPEPLWRNLRPDPIFTASHRLVDAGPQDLSPTYTDTTPTWKRRAALAARMPEFRADPVEPEPVPEPAAFVFLQHASPLDEAAEASAKPGHDARAPAATIAPQPAIADPVDGGGDTAAEPANSAPPA